MPVKKRMAERLGIVFTGGEGPRPELLRQIIGGNEALYAAADSGLMLAEAAGIKPDWIIGDMDSLDSEKRLSAYPAGKIIRCAADKDFTDTELAITLLREKNCTAVWVAGGGGGRTDHLFGIRELFEGEKFPCRWITATDDIYCVESGNPEWKQTPEPGQLVSVFLLGTGPWEAESRGLKWPLDNVQWKRGMTGLSNVATAGKTEIKVKRGRFMVILEEIWQR